MKKIMLGYALIGCLVLLAGCITVVIPTAAPTPTQNPPTATQLPPTFTPVPTATEQPIPSSPTPDPTDQSLQSAVVGFPPNGYVLYYDPTKWDAIPHDHTAGAWILVSKEFNGCTIKQLLGHGVDPEQTPLTTANLNFSGIQITYNVWRDKTTHFPAIVGYYWNNDTGAAEVFVKDNPEECLVDAQQVIKDSAAHGFAN